MARRRYRLSDKKLGASPGTITYVGKEISHATRIKRIDYNATDYRIDESGRLSACRLPVDNDPEVHWLNVDGIHEPHVIATLGQQYHLHPLLLEDVVNTEQKPKLEQYDLVDGPTTVPANGNGLPNGKTGALPNEPVLFLTLKHLHHNPHTLEIEAEHVSFVLGRTFLLSFQEERNKDVFQPVLERIQASAGKTRRNGPDYLLYALIDLIVDHYFVMLERIGEAMDTLEDQIIRNTADKTTPATVYALKREVTLTRRYVWPLREMIGVLLREDSALIRRETRPYLRDLHDHVNQVVETVDSYRDLLTGLLDVYYSTVSSRMNTVMKTLTIFSAIFMPLTFIAGIYGMNFDNMPELHTRTGYFWVLGAMLAIGIGEIIYFKRRGWM